MTMNEEDGLFRITPERVRQLKSMALRKLRQRWSRIEECIKDIVL